MIFLQKHHVLLVFQLSSSSPAVKASLHLATVKEPTSSFSFFSATAHVSRVHFRQGSDGRHQEICENDPILTCCLDLQSVVSEIVRISQALYLMRAIKDVSKDK